MFSVCFNVVGSLGFSILWAVVAEVAKKALMDWLPRTRWWKHALGPQKKQCENFGFQDVDEYLCRDAYAFVLFISGHHLVSVLPMLPVCWYGWDDVSDASRVAFVLGTLSVVGFDVADSIVTTIRTFAPRFAFRKFGWRPLPVIYWIIIVLLHHTLSIGLVIPMNLRYIALPHYHTITLSLLLAGGACYTTGCLKYSLDVVRRPQFLQYKAIVLLQLLVVVYSRIVLWFPNAFAALSVFHAHGDWLYLGLGATAVALLSTFNLILVFDALSAATKWLPMVDPPSSSGKNIRPLVSSSSSSSSSSHVVVGRTWSQQKPD